MFLSLSPTTTPILPTEDTLTAVLADALPSTAERLKIDLQLGLHSGGQLSIRSPNLNRDCAFGEARPNEEMKLDHRLLWLSGSKPLTAVAIAQLWEQGLLDFKDLVTRHIPEFGVGGKEAITIRHLLTHTSGIRMIATGWPELSWDEVIAKICARRIEPRWIPGEKAGYHLTSSWFILGEIIQRCSGLSFSHYLRDKVLQPAGMDGTLLGMDREIYRREQASFAPVLDTEHDGDPHPWTQKAFLVQPSPGANAIGPAADLARFYLTLLNGGQGSNGQILQPQTVQLITSRHRHSLYDHTFKATLDWGLGFILNPSIDRSTDHPTSNIPYAYGPGASAATFGHSGYRSVVAFADPQASLAVALIWNGTADEAAHRRRVYQTLKALYSDLNKQ